MGSKHTPPRWWRDFDEECRIADKIVRVENLSDGRTKTAYQDGSFLIANADGTRAFLGPAFDFQIDRTRI